MRRNTRTRYRSQFFPRWGCLVRSSCVPTVIVKNSDTNIVARRVQGELKCRTSFSLLTSLRREIIVHPWELPWKMKSETRMLLCFRSSLSLTAVVNVNWIENSFSRTLFRERVESLGDERPPSPQNNSNNHVNMYYVCPYHMRKV